VVLVFDTNDCIEFMQIKLNYHNCFYQNVVFSDGISVADLLAIDKNLFIFKLVRELFFSYLENRIARRLYEK